jgi:hypothetical protein
LADCIGFFRGVPTLARYGCRQCHVKYSVLQSDDDSWRIVAAAWTAPLHDVFVICKEECSERYVVGRLMTFRDCRPGEVSGYLRLGGPGPVQK